MLDTPLATLASWAPAPPDALKLDRMEPKLCTAVPASVALAAMPSVKSDLMVSKAAFTPPPLYASLMTLSASTAHLEISSR